MTTAAESELLTRVGPGTALGSLMREYWIPAFVPSELSEPDGAPMRLRLLGEDLIAFRTTSGRFGLMAHNCPHRGASLFFGRNEENGLRCVYHGWKFDVDGSCIDMPNEPAESDFKSKVGNSTQVSFPTGVGARGSAGVAGVVSQTQGAITYVDVAYALANKLKFAAVQNAAGKYTFPGLRAIAAAAATVKKVPADNAISIVNPGKSAPTAYPISTFTYVILPQKSHKAAELRKLVFWALTQGQQSKYTAKLLFVPIPKPVLVAAEKTLKSISL